MTRQEKAAKIYDAILKELEQPCYNNWCYLPRAHTGQGFILAIAEKLKEIEEGNTA